LATPAGSMMAIPAAPAAATGNAHRENFLIIAFPSGPSDLLSAIASIAFGSSS
jgi:hypothetical protein